LAEGSVVQFTDQVLATLRTTRLDDDSHVANKICEVVAVVGHFMDPETYLPRCLPLLAPTDRITPSQRAGTAAVLAEMLHASGSKVGAHIQELAAALVAADAAHMEDQLCQGLLLRLADVAILESGVSCDQVALPLCTLAAAIQVSASGHPAAAQALALEERLAVAVGAQDVGALWLHHLGPMLLHAVRGSPSWVHTSPGLRLFELLVGRTGAQVFSGPAKDAALDTCVQCTQLNRDARLRGTILGLLATVFSAPEGGVHCHPIAPVLLTECVLPNCTWRAGQAAASARTNAVRLLGTIVRVHTVKATYQGLLQGGLVPVLLSALEEEEAATRLLACQTLGTLFELLQGEVGYEDTKRSIPEVLKRLDDSRDVVRLSAVDTVTALVGVIQAQKCSTWLEYIVQQMLNYLEDSDRVMCDKAQTTLQSYAALDPDKFTQCVGTFMQRGTTSAMDRCNQLLSHARCLQAKEQMGS